MSNAGDGNDQSDVVEDLLAVPAWCDPKNRSVIFDWSSMLTGIFFVNANGVAFASEAGVLFSAPLTEVSVRWPRIGVLVRRCDLTASSAEYRFYFARPSPHAPKLGEDELGRVKDVVLSTLAKVGTFGSVGEKIFAGSEMASLAFELLSDTRRERANGDAVRKRLKSVEL
jgi:hypothetical protein